MVDVNNIAEIEQCNKSNILLSFYYLNIYYYYFHCWRSIAITVKLLLLHITITTSLVSPCTKDFQAMLIMLMTKRGHSGYFKFDGYQLLFVLC